MNEIIAVVTLVTTPDTYQNLDAAMVTEWDSWIIDKNGSVKGVDEEQEVVLEYRLGFDVEDLEEFLDAFMSPNTETVYGMEEMPHHIDSVGFPTLPDSKEVSDILLFHSLRSNDVYRSRLAEHEEVLLMYQQQMGEFMSEFNTMKERYIGLEALSHDVNKLPQYYGVLAELCKEMDMEYLLDLVSTEKIH